MPSAGVAAGASVAGVASGAGVFLEQVKPVVKESANKAATTIVFMVIPF